MLHPPELDLHERTTMNAHEEVSTYVPKDIAGTKHDGEIERWEIDPSGSRLRFTLRHLVVQQIRGEFRRWGGTLFLDRAEPWLSTVEVWIDVASIDTDSVERDDHIRSAEFLDIARFPRAEFESSSVEPREGHLGLRGRLQLHGVTRDLDLEVTHAAPKAVSERSTYSIRGKLNRQLFGLHWNQDLDVGGVVVGDEIELSAEVQIVRALDDKVARSTSERL
jgi:polyisoprenoid-binding protein YceI